MQPKDFVILSTADWDNPFWTNKQHVAVELAKLGHRIFYIDSLGLRRPSASGRDIKRIWKRVAKSCRPPQQVRKNLWVWSPIVLPLNQYLLVRKMNRWLLQVGLSFWLRILRLRRDILWTYNPMTMEFFELSCFGYTVYHCVDEIKAQPGMPAEIMVKSEERLARAVDVIFVTSQALEASRRPWNSNTHYFANVADFTHFSTALDPALEVPPDLIRIPEPRLGFIGAISAYKVDLDLVCRIARRNPGWSIFMIGNVGEGDPWTNAQLLKEFKNIHLLGPKRYQDLPAYLKGASVALLPNMLNEYTKSMFPMKFFEYLAAGKAIVAVDLDAIKGFSDVACIAKSEDEFVAGIENALVGNVPSLETRLAVARQYTYEARTINMLDLIDQQMLLQVRDAPN